MNIVAIVLWLLHSMELIHDRYAFASARSVFMAVVYIDTSAPCVIQMGFIHNIGKSMTDKTRTSFLKKELLVMCKWEK